MAKSQNDRAVIDLVINGKQAQTSLKDVSLAATNARSALNKMKETDPGYKDRLKELHALLSAQRQMTANINQTTTAWGRFKANAASTATGLLGGNLITAGLSAAANAIPALISKYREFDAASKDLSAVTGATGKDLDYLNRTAAKVGPTLGKSGAEMLEAYKLMASAKPELLNNIELLTKTTEAAITLSQAGKIDLAQATEVTAESLNQFGESADQANRFINVIAAGAKEGSAEIADMGAALKNSGTVAAAQGVTFEQTNAVLQSLSTIALKGGEAGTQLRNVLLTLGSGANETNPKVVGLEKALENLGKKNLSTAEMTQLFGKENITAAQHIITHRNEISELTRKVTGTQEAFTQAKTNNESLDHQLEIFWARVEGLAIILGTKLVPVFTKVIEAGIGLAKLLTGGLTPASQAATQAFEDQRAKVQNLTKNFAPLLDRHDELKKKTKLTADEQAELKTIVAQVASTVPSAVTEFDKYGKVLGVNTDKARDFIRMQKELLKYTNREALQETQSELDDKRRDLQIAIQKRKGGVTIERDPTGMGYRNRQLTEAELKALDLKIAQLNDEVAGLVARRSGLNGDYLNVPTASATKPTDKPAGGGGSTGETKEEKAARLKREREAKAAEKHENTLQKLNEDARARKAKQDDDEFLREQVQFGEHYAEMFRQAKGNKAEMEAVTKLMYDELESIVAKHSEKEKLLVAKDLRDEREAAEQELLIKKQLALYDIDAAQERGQINDDAARMARLQAENAFLLAKRAIYNKYYEDIESLDIRSAEKRADVAKERNKSEAENERDLTKNYNAQVDARLAYAEAADQKELASQKARKEAVSALLQETLSLMQINWTEQLQGIKDFWNQATVLQKAAFVASKAYSVAEATVAYARTLMNIWANSGNPLAAVGYTAMATATYGTVLGKIASANYNVPQFAQGGFTGSGDVHPGVMGPSGWVEFPTLFQMGRRQFIASEKGREFVISNRALQNPVVANFARIMDVAQKSGNYGLLQSGIAGGTPALPPPTPQAALPSGMSHEMGMAILQQLQRNNELMDKYANRSIVFDYRLFEHYQKEVQQIRASNSL
ncbi:hypothetical protein GCM10028805_60270 [Spirosoma harenae]